VDLNVSSKDLNKTPSGNLPASPQKSVIKLDGSASQTQQSRAGSISESGPGVDVEAISAASRRAAGMLNVLSTAQTSIFVGTELGQTILCDWLRNKDGTINQEQGQRGTQISFDYLVLFCIDFRLEITCTLSIFDSLPKCLFGNGP